MNTKLHIDLIEYGYDQDSYGTDEQIFRPSKKLIELHLKSDRTITSDIVISKETLITDDKFYNLGILSNNFTF